MQGQCDNCFFKHLSPYLSPQHPFAWVKQKHLFSLLMSLSFCGLSRIGLQKTEDFISFVIREKVSVLFYRLLHLLDALFSDLCQNQVIRSPDLAIWQGNTDNKNIGKYRVEGHALGTLKNREWPSYLSVVMECHGQRRNSSHEEFHLLKDPFAVGLLSP